MAALDIRFHRGGVYLPDLGLWLDPHEPKTGSERVFVSHAHSDHIGNHREIILSPPTAKLMRARLSGEWQEHAQPYGKPVEYAGPKGSFAITLVPAGHIFGSAMAWIEAGGQSLLYTGDFKLRQGLSAERCEPRQADVLIMETTYGRPRYQFPATSDILKGIIRFCQEALDNEETPVLLGYSLGKSQELLRGLAEAALPIMLHSTVHRLTKIYEHLGQSFPPYTKFDSSQARGKVLICPPNVVNSAALRHLGAIRVAVLTGWALDTNCRYRYQAHAAFPLSDHADFPDLLELVAQVKPKLVYTLHGFAADFAQTLRDRGHEAHALTEPDQPTQLALPLAYASAEAATKEARFSAQPAPPATNAALASSLPLSPSPAPDSEGVATSLPNPAIHAFERFALTCAEIASTAKKLEKTALLAGYLKTLDRAQLRLVSPWFTGHPFPPIENKVLQLGWAIIRDALCEVARIDHNAFGQCYLKHSDLGETAFEILQKTACPKSTCSIETVGALFQELTQARGPNVKGPVLARMLRRGTALEGKYLVKILTGDLRIGLKEGLVEEAIAQAFGIGLESIRTTNLLLGNIGETAELAQAGQLTQATLVPFRPVKFMLASPEETADDIWQRVLEWSGSPESNLAKEAPLPLGIPEAPTVWLEDKYDGIRCQMHKVGKRVALYSRDLREITTTFLDVADAVRSNPADFILDGELLAMRGTEILPFGELQKRLGRREGDLFLGQQIPVRFVAFDLLWFAGDSYLNRPLHERRQALEQIEPGELKWALITRARSEAEIEQAFIAARARGNEGLMIKEPSSIYTPGRRGLSWLKLKKAYGTIDCVVVGAEYGHGKRKSVLSDYTFAVRDDQSGELRTIGKAYSGLTDAEIATLTAHFLNRTLRQSGRYLEVEPDTVLEIAFDSVQVSNRHSSGLALRFPRIARIRADKTLAEIATLSAARKLVRASGSKTAAAN